MSLQRSAEEINITKETKNAGIKFLPVEKSIYLVSVVTVCNNYSYVFSDKHDALKFRYNFFRERYFAHCHDEYEGPDIFKKMKDYPCSCEIEEINITNSFFRD